MRTYTVRRRVDAYVNYVAEVPAGDPLEAVEIAQEHEDELDWVEDGVSEFDDRLYIALDANGFEIERTERRR